MPTHKPVDTTPQNIEAIASELARCAADLKASAEAIRDCGYESLDVMNFGRLRAAVLGANSYVKGVRDALWKSRENRGDFGTKVSVDGKGKKGRRS